MRTHVTRRRVCAMCGSGSFWTKSYDIVARAAGQQHFGNVCALGPGQLLRSPLPAGMPLNARFAAKVRSYVQVRAEEGLRKLPDVLGILPTLFVGRCFPAMEERGFLSTRSLW